MRRHCMVASLHLISNEGEILRTPGKLDLGTAQDNKR